MNVGGGSNSDDDPPAAEAEEANGSYAMEGRIVEIVPPKAPGADASCVVLVTELDEEVDVDVTSIRPKTMEAPGSSPENEDRALGPPVWEKLVLQWKTRRRFNVPVCSEEVPEARFLRNAGCGHGFCRDCWSGYLRVQIREGGGAQVVCAAFECPLRVDDAIPKNLFEEASELGPAMSYERWQQIRVAAFVGEADDLAFCPGQDCTCVVKRNGSTWRDRTIEPLLANASCTAGHTFCWQCRSEHALSMFALGGVDECVRGTSRAKEAAMSLKSGNKKRGGARQVRRMSTIKMTSETSYGWQRIRSGVRIVIRRRKRTKAATT